MVYRKQANEPPSRIDLMYSFSVSVRVCGIQGFLGRPNFVTASNTDSSLGGEGQMKRVGVSGSRGRQDVSCDRHHPFAWRSCAEF